MATTQSKSSAKSKTPTIRHIKGAGNSPRGNGTIAVPQALPTMERPKANINAADAKELDRLALIRNKRVAERIALQAEEKEYEESIEILMHRNKLTTYITDSGLLISFKEKLSITKAPE